MKRNVALAIGISTMLCTTSVQAEAPISTTYLPNILKRADNGIQKAKYSPPVNNFTLVFWSWFSSVQATIASALKVENSTLLHSQNIVDITPCLQYDLLLLEAKIDEVHDELIEAIAQKRTNSILLLKELSQWLQNRYNNLLLGATNPSHVDTEITWHYAFDNTAWCCTEPQATQSCTVENRTACQQQGGSVYANAEECGQVCAGTNGSTEAAPVCPFDTNYLPPTAAGYGCDATALKIIQDADGSVGLEVEAFLLFEQRKKEFLEEHADMVPAGDLLLEFAGRTADVPILATQPRQHLRVTGCAADASATSDTLGVLPPGAARIALRSPFSYSRDEIKIASTLENVLRQLGKKREQSEDLTIPSDYPIGSAERTAAEAREARKTILQKLWRPVLRSYYAKVNEQHASKEALPLLQSIDAQQRVEEEFLLLRKPMQALSEMANSRDRGVRKFVANYAAFLRKSCIYRPCNVLLNRILTIVSDDQCFPYVSGQYLEGYKPSDCGSNP